MRSWAALALMLWSCEVPVTETTVSGSVRGVRLGPLEAVTRRDANLFDGERQTVWLGAPPLCERLRQAPLGDDRAFEPSFARLPDAGQVPLLILQTPRAAWFDTGRRDERIDGAAKLEQLRVDEAGTASGRFVATFPRDGGAPEEVVGSFVASPCDRASGGCTGAPGDLGGAVAVLVLWLRRARARRATY